MTKYEVKDKLSEYYKACSEAECIKKRIEVLTASKLADNEVNERLEELNNLYKKAVLNADLALARTLKIINTLNNTDCDVDVLKKYHIDGLSEKVWKNRTERVLWQANENREFHLCGEMSANEMSVPNGGNS